MRLGRGLKRDDVSGAIALEAGERIVFVCKCNSFNPVATRLVLTDRRLLAVDTNTSSLVLGAPLKSNLTAEVAASWQGSAVALNLPGKRFKFGGVDPKDGEVVCAAVNAGDSGGVAALGAVSSAAGGHGRRVEKQTFGGKTVEIYSGGYVRVGMLLHAGHPYERLRSIEARHIQQDKSAGGRALAAVATLGASTLYSNEHRLAFLTIATDSEVHSLQEKSADRRAFTLEAAGKGVLEALRSEAATASAAAHPVGPAAPALAASPTAADRLRQIADLHRDGLLSDEEHAAARVRLLKEL